MSTYALIGPELDPTYFVLDADDEFFALIYPEFLVIREGYEDLDELEMAALGQGSNTAVWVLTISKPKHQQQAQASAASAICSGLKLKPPTL